MSEPADASADFDALWDDADPAGTEAKLLVVRQTLGGDANHGRLMELDTQRARAQGLQGRFGDALMTLEDVQLGLRPGETRAEIRFHLEMGRVLSASGYPDGARPYFERARAMAERAGEAAIGIDASAMFALVEADPGRRVVLLGEAAERAAASAEPAARAWRGRLWTDIGAAFQVVGRLDQALEAFETAAACFGEDDPARVAGAYWMVGSTLRLQGRLEEALAVQESLAREHERAGTDGGYVQEELGEIHLAMAEGEGAVSHRLLARSSFARAYDLLKDSRDLASEPERLARMKRLALGEPD